MENLLNPNPANCVGNGSKRVVYRHVDNVWTLWTYHRDTCYEASKSVPQVQEKRRPPTLIARKVLQSYGLKLADSAEPVAFTNGEGGRATTYYLLYAFADAIPIGGDKARARREQARQAFEGMIGKTPFSAEYAAMRDALAAMDG